MKTPIIDFVEKYKAENSLRLHMPGHKGRCFLGFEDRDITEIKGADSLYEADGIIRESELNAGRLFGCNTFYSAEGSSQCIRAMLYLACLYAKEAGKKPIVAAARNVHKTFLSAAALIGFDVEWVYPENAKTYLTGVISAESLRRFFGTAKEKPSAVYITSPDYLGYVSDVKEISAVCKEYGALLLVDNAHGAYRKFLPQSQHPMDLGADICCDSAHKTLPVITGGAYLHVSNSAPEILCSQSKNALAMFSSTSPSYLVLQSLDGANYYIESEYNDKLAGFVLEVEKAKDRLVDADYKLCGDEDLKITIDAKAYGYRGCELADEILEKNIVCEFSDPDYLVLMLTPEVGSEGLLALENALLSIPRRERISEKAPEFHKCKQVMSIRDAMLSPSETVSVEDSIGRILASPSVSCPPAVPIVVCGEEIDREAVEIFKYYGCTSCTVVK